MNIKQKTIIAFIIYIIFCISLGIIVSNYIWVILVNVILGIWSNIKYEKDEFSFDFGMGVISTLSFLIFN